jgi:carboxypeptidase C (cathepsin A)
MKKTYEQTFPIIALIVLAWATPAPGQETAEDTPASVPAPEPREFVSDHTVEVDGKRLRYRAVAGETLVADDDGDPQASIFAFSYLLEGIKDPAERPITFFFNGGPGSTAVWLHLGAFGPRRLALDDAVQQGAPPYELAPNPYTLLPATDMVFVDPVGTGYSRALGGKKDSEFWGMDEDADVLTRYVHTWLTKNRRWGSPKYLCGESYGTTRVSLMVRDLQLDLLQSLAINGVILVSAALDARIFLDGQPGNELRYVTNLPTFAATAWYHNVLPDRPDDLEQFLLDARTFASTDYLTALFAGDALSPGRRDEIVARLHHFTGLSEKYIRRADLRVDANRFLKELLRDRGQVLAVHDARVAGEDPDDVGDEVVWDPLMQSLAGPFVAAVNAYLADDLEARFDERYKVFSIRAVASWKRGKAYQRLWSGWVYTTPWLAEAAAANPDFRIFVASGYHDLTTTFFGVEHTFDHSGIDRDRITVNNYDGGHMMYLRDASLEALSGDIREFIEKR